MHGLVNQAIERFACETYDAAFWADVCRNAGLGFCAFEAMLDYDNDLTDRVLGALARALGKDRDEVLEDIGTFLVSGCVSGAVRRLLRFSGTDYVDFLQSLDDLPARVRLAVPDVDVPRLELREHAGHCYTLAVRTDGGNTGRFGHVMIGLLRAMADDYGALVLLEYKGRQGSEEIIGITLLKTAFAAGRAFDLGARAR